MFFLIRCVFWLTIVFHAMTWPPETWPPETWSIPAWSLTRPLPAASPQSAVMKMASDTAANLSEGAGTAVAAKLEEGCLKAPAECLAIAARLPQIVATTQSTKPMISQMAANQAIANQAIDILPPKRPAHLVESDDSAPSSARKLPIQHY